MQAPIRLERVSKDYSEGDERRSVLHETSASFGEGQFVAIRGRSGSGKSTAAGSIRPASRTCGRARSSWDG